MDESVYYLPAPSSMPEKAKIEQPASVISETMSHRNYRVLHARQIGRGHVRKGQPCQDHTGILPLDQGLLLGNLDGVSQSKYSERGAGIAWEVICGYVRKAVKSCDTEEKLATYLTGLPFRQELVRKWRKKVSEDEPEDPEDKGNLREYATTVMFVLITDHYYICNCLGDGQILLFNEKEALKLRNHDPKQDSYVRSLAGKHAYVDDFKTAILPKEHYDGVLLCTDGIYDALCMGTTLHQYALELSDRLAQGEMEKTFRYTDRGVVTEIREELTYDDCSVVLAVQLEQNEDPKTVSSILEESCDRYVMLRDSGLRTSYLMQCGDAYNEVIVSESWADTAETEFHTFCLRKPNQVKNENDHWYAVYSAECMPDRTLEEESDNGELTRKEPERVSNRYRQFCAVRRELMEHGYDLSEDCGIFCGVDDQDRLIVPESAVVRGEVKKPGYEKYFEHLLGVLIADENAIVIWNPGMECAEPLQTLELSDGTKMNFAVLCHQGKTVLLNAGTTEWCVTGIGTVGENGWTELKQGLEIEVTDGSGESHRITYVKKEEW